MRLSKLILGDFLNYTTKDKFNYLKFLQLILLNSSFRAVFLFRLSNYFDKKGIFPLAYFFEKLMHITTVTWISRSAKIGLGFVIRHVGAIVIGGKSQIGENCEIRQGVTLGGNLGKENHGTTQPILGKNILVGAGAKILGPVKIGDNCIIGANAVVIRDIPENSVVGGVPARILREVRKGENPLLNRVI